MIRQISIAALAFVLASCATSGGGNAVSVAAVIETPPVGQTGDAADDPAIWVAADPAQSRIVGTQKKGGLFVYDLAGRTTQEIPYGQPNNIDVRDAFPWRDGAAPIFAASDRADNSVTLWRMDPATGLMDAEPRARIPTGWVEVYGVCAGRMGDDFVVLATSKEGDVKLWRLAVGEDGAVTHTLLGGFALGSIAEGCVIDDANSAAYVGQELVGVWRYSLAQPNGDDRRAIDRVGPEGRLREDVEGVALWDGGNGQGYIVVSVQGRSTFAVYDRTGDNAYRGEFRIAASADGAVDAVSGTDGLDIVSAPLGAAFPRGLVVVQDDRNTAPNATQNFKYVSWADVAAALNLD